MIVQRAEIIQEKGTNRQPLLPRSRSTSTPGSTSAPRISPSEINAAFLWAQLEQAESITRRRLEIWNRYHEAFEPLEQEGLLRRPFIPGDCGHNGHIYYVLLPAQERRDAVLAEMKSRGVHAVFHYVPLHSSPAAIAYGRSHGDNRVATDASARLLRLPLWPSMSELEVERVIDVFVRALETSGGRVRL